MSSVEKTVTSISMESTLSSLLTKKGKRRISKVASTKEKLKNLVRAVEEQQQGIETALAHLADSLLDPCCSRGLAVIQSLMPRLLSVVGPLLLMDDDPSCSLFLTKAKRVVVNLAQTVGLKAVIFTIDPYRYDDAEHVRLTAIRVLGEIVRTMLVTTDHQQVLPQYLKFLTSDALETGLRDESVRVQREAALWIVSLAKVSCWAT